jgi:hypothetical protein
MQTNGCGEFRRWEKKQVRAWSALKMGCKIQAGHWVLGKETN